MNDYLLAFSDLSLQVAHQFLQISEADPVHRVRISEAEAPKLCCRHLASGFLPHRQKQGLVVQG